MWRPRRVYWIICRGCGVVGGILWSGVRDPSDAESGERQTLRRRRSTQERDAGFARPRYGTKRHVTGEWQRRPRWQEGQRQGGRQQGDAQRQGRSQWQGGSRRKPAASGKAAPGGRPAANLSADSVPPVAAAASGSFRWAVRVLYAEAVATGFVTLALIWLALAADNVSASSAIATVAFAALCAAILAGLATALARRKSLARGPAIVVQMLLVLIGYYMIAGGRVVGRTRIGCGSVRFWPVAGAVDAGGAGPRLASGA